MQCGGSTADRLVDPTVLRRELRSRPAKSCAGIGHRRGCGDRCLRNWCTHRNSCTSTIPPHQFWRHGNIGLPPMHSESYDRAADHRTRIGYPRAAAAHRACRRDSRTNGACLHQRVCHFSPPRTLGNCHPHRCALSAFAVACCAVPPHLRRRGRVHHRYHIGLYDNFFDRLFWRTPRCRSTSASWEPRPAFSRSRCAHWFSPRFSQKGDSTRQPSLKGRPGFRKRSRPEA